MSCAVNIPVVERLEFHTDLAERLNCPYCKVGDTNDHYRHYYMEPVVVVARKKHLALLAAAIHTFKFKSTTARALASMYTLDDDEMHIDPGAAGEEICAGLVGNLIAEYR